MAISEDLRNLTQAFIHMGAAAIEASEVLHRMSQMAQRVQDIGVNSNMAISSTVNGSAAFTKAVGGDSIGVTKIIAGRDIMSLSDTVQIEGVINKKWIGSKGYTKPAMKFNLPIPGGPISVELHLHPDSDIDAYKSCLTFILPDGVMVSDSKNTQDSVSEFKDAVIESMQERIDKLKERIDQVQGALAKSNMEFQNLRALTGKKPMRRQMRRRNSG